MKFVKSKHCATLQNEHLGELIRTRTNLSKFSETTKPNQNQVSMNNAFVVFEFGNYM